MNKTAFAGIDDALAAIDGLGELASHEVQIKALKAVAQPIAEDIRQRLGPHHETGATAEDIGVGESREAAGKGDAVVLVGAGKGRAYILRFLEFGTYKQRATPVIRPAWDAAAPAFGARVATELGKSYRAVIAKYSRKKAA